MTRLIVGQNGLLRCCRFQHPLGLEVLHEHQDSD